MYIQLFLKTFPFFKNFYLTVMIKNVKRSLQKNKINLLLTDMDIEICYLRGTKFYPYELT